MTTQASDQLVERLRRTKTEVRVHSGFGGMVHFHDPQDTREVLVNPDGPEAADALEAAKGLAVALEKAIADATGKPNVWFFDAKDALTKWNEAQP